MVQTIFRLLNAQEWWRRRVLKKQKICEYLQRAIGHLLRVKGILKPAIVKAKKETPVGGKLCIYLVDTRDFCGNTLEDRPEFLRVFPLHELYYIP